MTRLESLASPATIRRLSRAYGLQPLRTSFPVLNQIPPSGDLDFSTCPLKDICYGAKGPEFYDKCIGIDYQYLRCDIWDPDLTPIPREKTGAKRARVRNCHQEEESVHDALAEGVNPMTVVRTARAELRDSKEYRSLRESCWPDWDEKLAEMLREF